MGPPLVNRWRPVSWNAICQTHPKCSPCAEVGHSWYWRYHHGISVFETDEKRSKCAARLPKKNAGKVPMWRLWVVDLQIPPGCRIPLAVWPRQLQCQRRGTSKLCATSRKSSAQVRCNLVWVWEACKWARVAWQWGAATSRQSTGCPSQNLNSRWHGCYNTNFGGPRFQCCQAAVRSIRKGLAPVSEPPIQTWVVKTLGMKPVWIIRANVCVSFVVRVLMSDPHLDVFSLHSRCSWTAPLIGISTSPVKAWRHI